MTSHNERIAKALKKYCNRVVIVIIAGMKVSIVNIIRFTNIHIRYKYLN